MKNGPARTNFQGISLDYRRFMSDSLLECYKIEYAELKKHTPHIPVTTNLMGTYPELNYFEWAKHMDVISWDNYPALDTPVSYTAMVHDLMRGLKSGQPFMLMEQTPSQQNWQHYNSLKPPGVMRLWSYQAVARGADTVMFFQLRRSTGACEKFHGAEEEVHKYYDALFQLNIQTDMIGVEEDLGQYDIVIAPVLYMIKPGYAQKIGAFVQNGGTFVTTFFSGIVNENDLVTTGGYPGELRKVLGIWAEEIDALFSGQKNEIVMSRQWGNLDGSYECGLLCDLVHSEGSEVIAEYGADFYKGMPVVTANRFGSGRAWYVASSPDAAFLTGFLSNICDEKGIKPDLKAPVDVEVSRRTKNGNSLVFLLNHNAEAVMVNTGEGCHTDLLTGQIISGEIELPGRGVMVLASEPGER